MTTVSGHQRAAGRAKTAQGNLLKTQAQNIPFAPLKERNMNIAPVFKKEAQAPRKAPFPHPHPSNTQDVNNKISKPQISINQHSVHSQLTNLKHNRPAVDMKRVIDPHLKLKLTDTSLPESMIESNYAKASLNSSNVIIKERGRVNAMSFNPVSALANMITHDKKNVNQLMKRITVSVYVDNVSHSTTDCPQRRILLALQLSLIKQTFPGPRKS
jgi:hypothetical protein